MAKLVEAEAMAKLVEAGAQLASAAEACRACWSSPSSPPPRVARGSTAFLTRAGVSLSHGPTAKRFINAVRRRIVCRFVWRVYRRDFGP
jgi:hypothetical protein